MEAPSTAIEELASIPSGNGIQIAACLPVLLISTALVPYRIMFRFLVLAMFLAVTQAFMAPVSFAPRSSIVMQHGGKGFGGGEATRDPEPTYVDPNDPKGKQQAIHKAESFADYLAKRNAGAGAVTPTAAPAPAPAAAAPAPAAAPAAAATTHGGKGFGGGEATRDPAPTYVDPNDPKGKQQAIHKAESFADYLAKRQN